MVRILAILAALILVAAPAFAQMGSSSQADKPAAAGEKDDKAKAADKIEAPKKDATGSASPATGAATDPAKPSGPVAPAPAPAPSTDKK